MGKYRLPHGFQLCDAIRQLAQEAVDSPQEVRPIAELRLLRLGYTLGPRQHRPDRPGALLATAERRLRTLARVSERAVNLDGL